MCSRIILKPVSKATTIILFRILHSQQSVAMPPKDIWTSLISSFWTGIDLYNLVHGLAVRPIPIKRADTTNNMK